MFWAGGKTEKKIQENDLCKKCGSTNIMHISKMCGSLPQDSSTVNVGVQWTVNQWMSTSATNSERLLELSCEKCGWNSVADFSSDFSSTDTPEEKVSEKEKEKDTETNKGCKGKVIGFQLWNVKRINIWWWDWCIGGSKEFQKQQVGFHGLPLDPAIIGQLGPSTPQSLFGIWRGMA
jgi:hypothetical protein